MRLAPEFVLSINSFDFEDFPELGEKDFEPKLIAAITANFARQGRSVEVKIEDDKVHAKSEVAIELDGAEDLETLYYYGFFSCQDRVLELLSDQMTVGTDAIGSMVELLSRIDRLEAIVPTIKTFDYTSSANASALVGLGEFLYRAGEHERGLEVLSYASRKYPEDADANRCLGIALFDHSDLELAIATLRRGLKSNPADHEAMLYLAEALTELDEPEIDEADQLCASVIRDSSRDEFVGPAIELRHRIAAYRAL